jgi:cyanate lyase
MDKNSMMQTILAAKGAKDLSWQEISDAIGKSVVWTTSACLGQNSMSPADAEKLCDFLDLPEEVGKALVAFPYKGQSMGAVPTDPLVYRLYEVVLVYGETMKEVIQEKFGDGIMSAIDFTMDIEKVPDPKGDRVKVTMNGKFLPYKTW